MARQRSTAWTLAALYAGVVVYASLYPFSGWRWPPGGTWSDVLWLPWPPWRDRFDEGSNLAGYLPLGLLLYVAVVRSGGSALKAAMAGVLVCAVLSLGMEWVQGFLPARFPSARDWLLNALGALSGVVLAGLLQALGLIHRWAHWRARWFLPQAHAGLVLLLLWPVALLFPSPVALGLGQLFGVLLDTADTLVQGSFLAQWLDPSEIPAAVPDRQPLTPLAEAAAIALGLLGPCMIAFASMRPGWRRLMAVGILIGVALAASTLSTALNFGPAHALAWLTPVVWLGILAGALTACGVSLLRGPAVSAMGLVLITAAVTLVAQAPQDPYYAASLRLWEQGQFIRFHGMAQWVGWIWPYAAGTWLLLRLTSPNRSSS